jgi:ribosomal protein S18 acetylase RimI-like enzyme
MDGLAFREIGYGSREYAEALILRTAILRAPLGLSYSEADLAVESSYRHGAGFLEGKIVVYGQMKNSVETGWLQMKQVAVDAALQGSGIGRALIGFLEGVAREAGVLGIVLHARESAAGFYDRLGYVREGERFIEVGIPHWKMRKGFGAADSA